ncbi:MAG: hypothetical protein PUB07_00525, partial [Clostridia bacterium]|nr:hypothetical protein [Clostridia bacterium]
MKKRGLALLIVSTMIAAMLFVLPASAATDTIPFHADFEEGLPTCVKAGEKTSLDTNITAAVVGGRNCMKVSALTSGDNNAYVKITLPTLETGKAYKLSAMFYFDSAEMNGGFAQLYLAGNSVNTNDRPGIKLKDTNMPTDTWFPMEWIVRGRSDANFLYCLVQRKVNSTTDTTVYFDDIQLSAYESDELMLNGDFETVMTKTSDSNYKQPVGWVYGKGSSHEPDANSGSQWVPDESTSDYGISLVSDTQSYDGNTLFVCSNALRNASYEIPALENGATYKISLMAKSTSTS